MAERRTRRVGSGRGSWTARADVAAVCGCHSRISAPNSGNGGQIQPAGEGGCTSEQLDDRPPELTNPTAGTSEPPSADTARQRIGADVAATASAWLLAVGAIWLLTGATAAGRALTRAVTDGGEDERTLAGMLLVRAGDRSVPVVTEAILSGRGSTALIDVLASIGSHAARDALVRVSRAAAPAVDPVVAAAAGEALRTLDQAQGRERGNSRDI
jgi:hypothetical protein